MIRRSLAAAASFAVAAASAVVLGGHLRSAGQDWPAAPEGVDDVVAALCTGLGLFVALWYAATSLATLLVQTARFLGLPLRGLEAAVRRWGAPLLRRLAVGTVVASTGLALSSGAAAAPEQPVPEDLGPGLSIPVEPEEIGDHGRERPAVHRVQPGESLWSITAAHLPGEAADARIAAAWPVLYETNRDAIGPDPDLIRPGLVLHVPEPLDEERG